MKLKDTILEDLKEKSRNFYDQKGRLNIERLCESLKLECWNTEFDDDSLSGAIVKDNDKFTIYVNGDHHENRKRFTICHEIGHYISYLNESYSKEEFDKQNFIEDKIVPVMARLEGNSSKAETEANLIAAELLMPAEKVIELVNKGYFVEEMAKIFGVSSVAMQIRLKSLGLPVAAAIESLV